MAKVLQESGATSIPLPPTEEAEKNTAGFYHQNTTTPRHSQNDPSGMYTSCRLTSPHQKRTPPTTNTRSNSLHHFLRKTVDADLISSRQQARWDAKTVATMARRRLGFVAIDATRTRWSSSTVASLLRRLVSVSTKFSFRVPSFSPLRLIFCPIVQDVSTGATTSNNNDNIRMENEKHVHVNEGALLQNPSPTPVQWVQSLSSITHERIKTQQQENEQSRER